MITKNTYSFLQFVVLKRLMRHLFWRSFAETNTSDFFDNHEGHSCINQRCILFFTNTSNFSCWFLPQMIVFIILLQCNSFASVSWHPILVLFDVSFVRVKRNSCENISFSNYLLILTSLVTFLKMTKDIHVTINDIFFPSRGILLISRADSYTPNNFLHGTSLVQKLCFGEMAFNFGREEMSIFICFPIFEHSSNYSSVQMLLESSLASFLALFDVIHSNGCDDWMRSTSPLRTQSQKRPFPPSFGPKKHPSRHLKAKQDPSKGRERWLLLPSFPHSAVDPQVSSAPCTSK